MKILRLVRAKNTIDNNFARVSRLANKKHNGPHITFQQNMIRVRTIAVNTYIADTHLQAQVTISKATVKEFTL